jgi:hypothetical protein
MGQGQASNPVDSRQIREVPDCLEQPSEPGSDVCDGPLLYQA